MNILESEEVSVLKKQLLNKLNENISLFENELEKHENAIPVWHYATDEYYTPIPLFHELDKLKRGRLLKKLMFEERFEKTNTFSFGFSGENLLLLTQHSNGKGLGINSKVYKHYEDGTIEYFLIRTYFENEFPSKLVSLGILDKSQPSKYIDVRITNDNSNWSSTVYQLDNENNIDKVFRYASGWNGQTEYNIEYTDGILSKIKIGTIDWWKAKSK